MRKILLLVFAIAMMFVFSANVDAGVRKKICPAQKAVQKDATQKAVQKAVQKPTQKPTQKAAKKGKFCRRSCR